SSTEGRSLELISQAQTTEDMTGPTHSCFFQWWSREDMARTDSGEHLVSAWQRRHPRDISTPLQSPAVRDPSESVEMTDRWENEIPPRRTVRNVRRRGKIRLLTSRASTAART